jgi:peptidoglycan-N-acetylglucosamine deacetylase
MPMDPWLVAISGAIAGAAAGTVYGAAYPRSQTFGSTICRTGTPRKLAITFDDGPNPAITPKLLDLLDRHNARATFFLIGRFVRTCPGLVRETVERGHALGNHTETHPNLFWCSPNRVRRELRHCQEAIVEILGVPPRWFRPPYGFRNPWVVSTAAELGMKTVMWTLIPGDWREKPVEWLIRRMEPIARHGRKSGGAGHRTGDVLCIHDGSHRALNGDRTRTVAALEHWLPRWRDLGLEFVTIPEAVSIPAP